MKIIYGDTETTDKNPGQICQLSYIVEEDGKIVKNVKKFLAEACSVKYKEKPKN